MDLTKQYPKQKDFEKSMTYAFTKMQLEIDEMIEDSRYSGCTCTCALIFGKYLYVSNLGDSRIVMV